MPGVPNRLRVIGAGPSPFGRGRKVLGVGGLRHCEFESRQFVIAEHGRASRAVNTNFSGEACARPASRRARERRSGAVGEFDPARGNVFDLDALMGDEPGGRRDALHWAEEPKQQVDGVDALIHQGPAAIEGERATPSGGIVVGLCTPPRDKRPR